MKKLLFAFIVILSSSEATIARAPAVSGNTICMGTIERVQEANNGWYEIIDNESCSFNANTVEGKKILAECPEGTKCIVSAYGTWAVEFYVKKVYSVRKQ